MARNNIIVAGCRVKAKVGELIDPPGGVTLNANGKKKRRVRREEFGTVVTSCGYRKWKVRFDHDSSVREMAVGALKKVPDDAGRPIGETVSVQLITIIIFIQMIN